MTTATITGADQAAAELAERLRAAGWEVRVNAEDGKRTAFSDGRLMIPRSRNVWVHADGPRAVGSPYLHAYWTTVIEETPEPSEGCRLGDTRLAATDITFRDGTLHVLATEEKLAVMVDALLAVAAALDA
jgi:hypothetical protein